MRARTMTQKRVHATMEAVLVVVILVDNDDGED